MSGAIISVSGLVDVFIVPLMGCRGGVLVATLHNSGREVSVGGECVGVIWNTLCIGYCSGGCGARRGVLAGACQNETGRRKHKRAQQQPIPVSVM